MSISIRAVYEGGNLRLLEPVGLAEGQQVSLVIEPLNGTLPPEEVDARLESAGLLALVDVPVDAESLSSEELDQLGRLFAADRLASDLVDEDRGLY